MQYILIGILMVCGYIYLLQIIARRSENRAALPVLALIMLVIYVIIAGPLLIILSQLGSMEMILLGTLLLVSCLILFAALVGFYRNFRHINKGMMVLFLTYMLAVAYITIFSRDGTNDTGIYLFRFDWIKEAIRTRSLAPMSHMLLNVAMFIPLGFLFPFILPEKLERWSYSLLVGMMCTTVIEAVQMILSLGQADMTDIVTNILGALIGYAIYAIFRHIVPREEDDDVEM